MTSIKTISPSSFIPAQTAAWAPTFPAPTMVIFLRAMSPPRFFCYSYPRTPLQCLPKYQNDILYTVYTNTISVKEKKQEKKLACCQQLELSAFRANELSTFRLAGKEQRAEPQEPFPFFCHLQADSTQLFSSPLP